MRRSDGTQPIRWSGIQVMTKSGDSFGMLTGLHQLLDDTNGAIHFSELSEISDAMLEGYACLVRDGRPGHTVAIAMLGATLNLYELFGLRSELPDLLRGLADKIEDNPQPN